MALTQLVRERTVPTRPSEALRLEIRAELARAGISGSKLARALGMPQPSVSERMSGKTRWSIDEAADVELVLGLEPGTLLTAAAVKCTPRDLNPEPTD